MDESKIFIIGAKGQLGLALQARYPRARCADIDKLDITDQASVEKFDWKGIEVILNAAAYTNVDGAETAEGRPAAWSVNADAVANLVAEAARFNAIIVHISTDYVFDGLHELHTEDEGFAPLSVYGASKAAGDLIVSLAPKFYILRTSWVIGDGNNFVRTIISLAKKDINPKVVADQYGRLTFTNELVRGIDYLLQSNATFGTYNLSNDGDIVNWADIAREVYKCLNRTDLNVSDTTAAEYFAGKLSAPRPTCSGLDLSKIKSLGYKTHDWRDDLTSYINKEKHK